MILAGVLLILVPLAFNGAFAALAARFDYPDVLREPATQVLAKFRAGGRSLVLLWWGFALTAVAMIPLVVLLSHAIDDADPTLLQLATTTGVIAGAVQFLGLILGVAVGEHLGYLFTGAWTTLIGVALTQTSAAPDWIGAPGIAYVAWSLWLMATGVALLVA